MGEEWPEVRLGELVTIHHGWAFPSGGCRPPGEGNYRLIRIGDFARTSEPAFTPDTVQGFVDEYPRRFRLNPDDLLMAMTCQSSDGEILGVTMRVPDDGFTYLHNQRIGRIQIDQPGRLLSKYLEYLTRVPAFNRHLFVTASGSKILHTSPSRIEDFRFKLPPLERQHQIAGMLGALDDLIDTNQRLAADADALATALWWERIGNRDNLQRRQLGELARVVLGGTPSRARPELWDGDIAWLNSGKANDFRVISPSELITKQGYEASSTKLMPPGATLIAITGATLGQVTRLEIEACGNQSLVGVFAETDALNDHLYYAVRAEVPTLLGHATGGAQQHVNKGNIEGLLVTQPGDGVLQEWHQQAGPLLATTRELLLENDTLRSARDELLPLLMSGAVSPGEVTVAS